MKQSRQVIAVDGLACSGKSTLARLLAERLGFVHLNTGWLYRAFGYLALQSGVSLDDEAKLLELIPGHKLQFASAKDGKPIFLLDGLDISSKLHDPKISEAASKSSRHEKVRAAFVSNQREAFPGTNLVAEGRDMGTIIFPDAALKFFIVADEKVRIERRIKQLYGDISQFTPERLNSLKAQVLIEITERDKRDTERAVAPTKAAADAVTIDNSHQSLTEVIENMYHTAANRLGLSA